MKFYIKKLGCPKNDVDGDCLAGLLIKLGHKLVDNESQADTIIVNTCGFILPAKEESINQILYYEELKKQGLIDRLFVTGCLSQRYGKELMRDIPLVDGFYGLGRVNNLAEDLDSESKPVLRADESSELKYISGDFRYVDRKYPYEYLKIAEGCNRYCAYCAIPSIRGKYRSRSLDSILTEAKMLAENGKKEIILVSQEGSGYGRDLAKEPGILNLLEKLEDIDGIEWIRLMYLHPEAVTDDMINYMADSQRVLGYYDIPLQHINDKILKMMNRRAGRQAIENVLDSIRKASADNIIRTTFITGLPGETDREFDELYKFIESFVEIKIKSTGKKDIKRYISSFINIAVQ